MARGCGACFWGVFPTANAEYGDCHNQPPKVFAFPGPRPDTTRIETVRPQVGRFERGCCFFSHKSREPAEMTSRVAVKE